MSGFKVHLYGGMAAGGLTAACFMASEPAFFTITRIAGVFITGTIGGLLPDLDSDTSRPFSMLFTILSLIVPVLFFREISLLWIDMKPLTEPVLIFFSKMQPFRIPLLPYGFRPLPSRVSPFPPIDRVTPEFIVTYFVVSYIVIRYGVCEVIKRLTTHRGIMHSIPFALLCSEAAFFIFIPSGLRMATAAAISLLTGFLSHLALDEVNSITVKYGFIPKLKGSAGTAMKLRSDSLFTTAVVYLAVLAGGVRIAKFFGF